MNESPNLYSNYQMTNQPSYMSLVKSPSQVIDKTGFLDTSNQTSVKKLPMKIDWKEKLKKKRIVNGKGSGNQ